jgi:DNA phosphorothioation-associated DGQHR protein 1
MSNFELNENEFIAVKVSQPFQDFYAVRLNSDYLLERSYSKAADFDGADISGNQRKITNKRLNEIGEFIDSDEATFPNSIIVAANYNKNDTLVDDDDKWKVEAIDESIGLYKLIIPSTKDICSIVDGQHRLFAFNKAKNKKMELQCSVYLDLIPSLQASIFATVNFNQSPVDKSVAYNLFGYQLDSLEEKYWSPDLLALNLCRYFSGDEESFFYNHINFRLPTRNVARGRWTISTASFVDGILGLISENPKLDRYKINKKEILSLAGRRSLDFNADFGLRKFFIEGNDSAIKQVVDEFFKSIRLVFNIEDESDSVLTKTIGVKSCFILLNEILKEKETIDRELLGSFTHLIEKAKDIPFENSVFFTSSTKGQTRILNCLKYKVLDRKLEDIISPRGSDTVDDYNKIINGE